MQDRPDAAASLRLQRDRLAVLRGVYPLCFDDAALVVVPEAVFVVRLPAGALAEGGGS